MTKMSSCCPPGSWGAPLDTPAVKESNERCIKIGDEDPLELYIAAPEGAAPKAILVFTDVYGFQNRLFAICNQLSTELNCHVVAMDNFRGETKDNHPDIWAWTSKHPYEVNDSDDRKEIHPVEADIEAVTQYIINKYGIPRSELSAIGFCWGVWPASKASNEFSFKCVVGFHPSLRFEENLGGNILEMMKDAVNVPHLYCVAGNDPDYIKDGGDIASMIEKSKHESKGENAKPRCVQFPDMMHGWVSRGDTSIKKVKDDADEALKLAVDFLKSWI